MKTITKIHAISLANILALMYIFIGVIMGLIMLVASLVMRTDSTTLITSIPVFVGFILLYGFLGWIGGYLCAWMFNLIAKRVGGIKFEVEDRQ